MILNHWLKNIADAVGINTRNQTRRRHMAVAPVAAEMELLETRQVMTASPLNVTAMVVDQVEHSPTKGGHSAAHNAVTHAAHLATASLADHHAAARGEQTAAATSQYVYSAVTFKNTTNITINYNFNWNGSTAKSFSLSPGQSRVHYVSALNKTATINFDKSFDPGFQNQRNSLAGQNITRSGAYYLVEPTPSVSEGKPYIFQRVTNGVQLYSSPSTPVIVPFPSPGQIEIPIGPGTPAPGTPVTPTPTMQWQQVGGLAKDIAVGADGSVWAIGTNPVGAASDFGIYKWDGSTWQNQGGGAVRIAVGGDGQAWVVNSVGQIFRRQGNGWEQVGGLGKDIGVGADGSVWLIGTNPVGAASDFGIYKWDGSTWQDQGGGAVRVAGQGWVVNSQDQIFHREANGWVQVGGRGKDISVGADGSVWLIGTNPVGAASDFGIYKWDGTTWQNQSGGGVQIAAGRNGQAWIVNSLGQIFRSGPSTPLIVLPGNPVTLPANPVTFPTPGQVTLPTPITPAPGTSGPGTPIPPFTIPTPGQTSVPSPISPVIPVPITPALQWRQIGGLAKDIAVGADGSVWAIGTNPVGAASDFGIYKWDGSTWQNQGGGAVRIAVGADGQAWVVNSVGQIFRHQGNGWEEVGGRGKDIGVGADGSVWLIGTNPVGAASDFGIYKWDGSTWQNQGGGAVRVAGQGWVVNSQDQIFHREASGWVQVGGRGKDISVGADGSVWLIGTNPVGDNADFGIYKWDGSTWQGIGGGGVQIAAGRNGQAWIVNSLGQIFNRS